MSRAVANLTNRLFVDSDSEKAKSANGTETMETMDGNNGWKQWPRGAASAPINGGFAAEPGKPWSPVKRESKCSAFASLEKVIDWQLCASMVVHVRESAPRLEMHQFGMPRHDGTGCAFVFRSPLSCDMFTASDVGRGCHHMRCIKKISSPPQMWPELPRLS